MELVKAFVLPAQLALITVKTNIHSKVQLN